MNLKEILMDGGGILIVICTLVQITPIQINPWTWIAQKVGKKIGKVINGEVIEKVDTLNDRITAVDQKVEKLEAKMEEGSATTCRMRIIRFGDEIYHGQRHSKEHFDQVLEDIKTYEEYCQSHPHYRNNKAKATIKRIRAVYDKCMEDKDFL